MRIGSVAAWTAALIVAGVLVVPPAAGAGGQFEPMYGDLNGDRIADRVRIANSSTSCGFTVDLGLPSGGYAKPVRYSYVSVMDSGNCGDMGAIIDLGGDGVNEIVLTGFNVYRGRDGLMVFRNFRHVATFDGSSFPSEIETVDDKGVPADFNGDGLTDIYEWTDQSRPGFSTYLNTRDSRLVPGPQVDVIPDQVLFADFNRNGRTDVAMSYLDVVSTGNPGVLVLLDDGRVVTLVEYGDNGFTVSIIDANRDRRPICGWWTTRDWCAPSSVAGTGRSCWSRPPTTIGCRSTGGRRNPSTSSPTTSFPQVRG